MQFLSDKQRKKQRKRKAMKKVSTEFLKGIPVGASVMVALDTTRDMNNASSACSYVSRTHGEIEGWRIKVSRDKSLKTMTITKESTAK